MERSAAGSHTRSLSWREVDRMARSLAAQIRLSTASPNVILAPARGGLVPAAILGHALGIRNVIAFPMQRTREDIPWAPKQPPLFDPTLAQPNLSGASVLIAEDIVGSGTTLCRILELAKQAGAAQAISAALVLSTDCHPRDAAPDFYALSCSGWVVFPWENTGLATPTTT